MVFGMASVRAKLKIGSDNPTASTASSRGDNIKGCRLRNKTLQSKFFIHPVRAAATLFFPLVWRSARPFEE
jgi:hypothetical protein